MCHFSLPLHLLSNGWVFFFDIDDRLFILIFQKDSIRRIWRILISKNISNGFNRNGAVMEKPVVFVVDDDESICRALKRLMKSVGLAVKTFTSSEDFLNHGSKDVPCCIVLDIRMPGTSGLELQEKLVKSGSTIPIIFISVREDIQAREQGLRAGAIAFLQKPFEDQKLLDAVYSTLKESQNDKTQ